MKISVNQKKSDLKNLISNKSEKMGMRCKFTKDKIRLEAGTDEKSGEQAQIPVIFKGTLSEENGISIIKGRFSNGFYLTTLVIIAAILILARGAWSVYKNQTETIIMCVVVAIILIVVFVVILSRGRKTKLSMKDFLTHLDKK